MKMLERKIDENYKILCEKNTMERENARSVKNYIMVTISGAAAIAGAVGSYVVAGPSGVRLFLSAIASAAGGGGIGAAVNAIVPANWINSESIVGRSIRFITSNLNVIQKFLHPRHQAVANEGATSATNTGDDPLSRIWNGAKSTAFSAINSILNYRFRRN